MRITPRHMSQRLERILLVTIVVLVVAHITGQLLTYYAPGIARGYWMEGIIWHFDMDHEGNVQTWFSQFLMLLNAGFALLLARQRVKERLAWLMVGLATFAVALDEFLGGHEVLLQNIHGRAGIIGPANLSANAWYYVIPFLGLGVLIGAWYLRRKLPRQTVHSLLLAALVFMTGALGVEIISSGFTDLTFFKNGILVVLEEGFELVGAFMLFRALRRHTEDHVPALKRNLKQL